MHQDISFPSADGKTTIHGVFWEPQGEVKGVLQLVHGMQEYIMRYDKTAEYFASRGYAVVGHDHIGHGQSITMETDLSTFPAGASDFLPEDVHTLQKMTREKYPDVPYFILGHSMGSFVVRKYIYLYGADVDGAMIMGTGYFGSTLLSVGRKLTATIGRRKGRNYVSGLVRNMGFMGYNKGFEPAGFGLDWLCSNVAVQEAYKNDPLCGIDFTVGAYNEMFRMITDIEKPENIAKMPKDLPVMFLAGEKDPVGQQTKGVKKVAELFSQAGMENVSVVLYPGLRHEVLNEEEGDRVRGDMLNFMEAAADAAAEKPEEAAAAAKEPQE